MAEQMNTADVEQGYTRIANQLLDAICQVEISARQFRVFMAIVRKTYGFNKSKDWISAEQVCELIGYESDYRNICADIRTLKSKKILATDGRKIGPNPLINEWPLSAPMWSESTTKVVKNNHKKDSKCSQNQPPKCSKSTTNVIENNHQEKNVSGQKQPPRCSKSTTEVVKNDHKMWLKPTTTKDKRQYSKDNITKDKARVGRATPTPQKFIITQALKDWLSKNKIQIDILIETERFLDYHRARGNTFKCWDSAWRNWMRRSTEFHRLDRQNQANVHPKLSGTTGLVDSEQFSDSMLEWLDSDDENTIEPKGQGEDG